MKKIPFEHIDFSSNYIPMRNPNLDLMDPAAIYGLAESLITAIEEKADTHGHAFNISECYNGGDQFWRECMALATAFETWACEWVDFNETVDVWPYHMNEHFGPTLCQLGREQDLNGINRLPNPEKFKLFVEICRLIKIPLKH